MKSKILTAVSVVMLFVPWTILPLRGFDWALQSPVAEIMIYSYAAFMVFSGIFSILVYTRGKVKSKLMQVCVAVNSIYAIGAIAIICTTIPGWINGSQEETHEGQENFWRCVARFLPGPCRGGFFRLAAGGCGVKGGLCIFGNRVILRHRRTEKSRMRG